MNSYVTQRIVPALIIGGPILQIVAQYVCIKIRDEIEMPGFLVFPLLLLDATLLNVLVFTCASWVYNVSVQVMRTQERNLLTDKKNSVLRRSAKACAVLKIKFGSNFIDNGRPLVIQNFCLNQTASLILIKRGDNKD